MILTGKKFKDNPKRITKIWL